MVRHNNTWGLVCDDGQEGDSYRSERAMLTARSACYTLGLGGGLLSQHTYSGSETFLMDEVICASNTTNFLQCSHDDWGKHDCGTSEVLLLTCT